MGNKKIDHYASLISRLPTGREWRGAVQRAVLKVIAEKIQLITDELILISQIKFLLFGDEIDITVQLNDGVNTFGSPLALMGEMTDYEGKIIIWEYILNLVGNGTIEERVEAIISALTNAGAISLMALEGTLQDAGYDVYVHWNSNNSSGTGGSVTFSETNTFGGVVSVGGLEVRFMSDLGQVDPNTVVDSELCVNYIDAEKDESKYRTKLSDDPRRWEYSFFIGGELPLERADVEEVRKSAFRELILKSKTGGMFALLLIDYI